MHAYACRVLRECGQAVLDLWNRLLLCHPQLALQQGQAPSHGSDALPQVVFSDGFAAACDVQVIGPVDLQVVQGSGLKSGRSVPPA